jgi:hypothetical protein
MPSPTWTHLIRFIAREDGQIHLGNVDPKKYPDIGLSTYNGEEVEAQLMTGSIFDGVVTNKTMHVKQVSVNNIKIDIIGTERRIQIDAKG